MWLKYSPKSKHLFNLFVLGSSLSEVSGPFLVTENKKEYKRMLSKYLPWKQLNNVIHNNWFDSLIHGVKCHPDPSHQSLQDMTTDRLNEGAELWNFPLVILYYDLSLTGDKNFQTKLLAEVRTNRWKNIYLADCWLKNARQFHSWFLMFQLLHPKDIDTQWLAAAAAPLIFLKSHIWSEIGR